MHGTSHLPALDRRAEYQLSEASPLLPRSEWLLVAMVEREFDYARDCAMGELDRIMFNLGDIGQPRGVNCSCGRRYESEVAWLWGVCGVCDIEYRASVEATPWDYLDDMYPCEDDRWEDDMGCNCPRHSSL